MKAPQGKRKEEGTLSRILTPGDEYTFAEGLRHLSRREALKAGLIGGGAVLLASCGGAAATPTSAPASGLPEGMTRFPAELTDIWPWGVIDAQISAQQILADKLGYYADEGLVVRNQLIQSGPDIGSMIAGGSAPVSFDATIDVIIIKGHGVNCRILTPTNNAGGTQAVVCRPDLNLTSARDLEGKTIGMPGGAGTLIAIRGMAQQLGVDVSRINFINMMPADAIPALEAGDIDCMGAWEPWITQAVKLGNTFLMSGTRAEFPELSGPVNWMAFHGTFQVTDDYIQSYPNSWRAMIRALKRATDFVNNSRDQAVEILSGELHIEATDLREMMNRNVYSMAVDEAFVNGCDAMADLCVEFGYIDEKPSFDSYTDFAFLGDVAPELVTAA